MEAKDTNTLEYADYLIKHQKSLRAKILQIPYRLHLKGLGLGLTLDVGCGAGRNLNALPHGSLGIDHNPLLAEACRGFGLQALTTDEWNANKDQFTSRFDSLLFSHVAEHMTVPQFEILLQGFLFALRASGRIVVICPQEAGYASDSTHVEFMDDSKISGIFERLGLQPRASYSFPFPRALGRYFRQNETVVIGHKSPETF
jgi:hypothetical protein